MADGHRLSRSVRGDGVADRRRARPTSCQPSRRWSVRRVRWRRFRVAVPRDREVIARLHAADAALIGSTVSIAAAAQREWAATPQVERGRVLRRAADIIRERNRELSVLETLDTGKPLQETLVADAASGADCLEHFGNLIATDTSDHIRLGGGAGSSFAYTRREPLGVCVGIGAWNYPIQIACWKAAPALAAGNSMIFKPSEVTPLSALQLAAVLVEAGRAGRHVQRAAGRRRCRRRARSPPGSRRCRSPVRCRPASGWPPPPRPGSSTSRSSSVASRR